MEEAKETDTRTESTSMEGTEGRDSDSGPSEAKVGTDQSHETDPRSGTEKRVKETEQELITLFSRYAETESIPFSQENATQMRHESSWFPVRRGVEDCYYYLKNGRCGYGRSCRFNHPPLPQSSQMRHDVVQPSPYPVRPQLPESSQMRHEMAQPSPYPVHPGVSDCRQYLQTGQCSYGPKCRYNHPPAPVLQDWVSRTLCKFFLEGNCKNGSGCKFTHSLSGGGADEPKRQVVATTWGKKFHEKRQGPKSSSRPWKRERQAGDLEEQKQKKRKVQNLRIGPTVQSGEGGIQTEQRLEVPENLNVIAQENQQEQADMERQNREAQEKAQQERRQQIDNERRQARLRLEQMRPRALSDNVDQVRATLPDIGIDRKEGDGF